MLNKSLYIKSFIICLGTALFALILNIKVYADNDIEKFITETKKNIQSSFWIGIIHKDGLSSEKKFYFSLLNNTFIRRNGEYVEGKWAIDFDGYDVILTIKISEGGILKYRIIRTACTNNRIVLSEQPNDNIRYTEIITLYKWKSK